MLRSPLTMRFARALGPLLLLATGCAGELIPNTDVPDTAQNRQVIQFVERYRHAVEARDVPAVLGLVSEQYLDDNGTITTEDDRDYDTLREQLARWGGEVLDVRYEMRYRRVTVRPNRIFVDFTYTGSFKIATPTGDRWSRRLADNRLELVEQDGEYRIVSGM
ncbi:MAG: nuclear transport factor 2 family protein [Sandaracinaceae bacterium]|nr:nuclear transport factor 2 family protein [Sandaracinaceae bacterium]